ncbi:MULTISPECIES: WbqC family protein [Planococcus]|uniref:Uncharacterized protein n=1 Tax=Planococcus kocurii TaxID=1374 RepID=A0ABM5WWK8_9BACL|nr:MULTISPECIES: WbqC family protein [Planococcus]ALS78736.1 hypothetical protein AUO94_08745 [Planococcus kocurii]KAA0955181.1 WbqC family protein [Planococcus sp. ANT_H30]MDJ0333514.1 WbqC family protein [Planococcus sp. S3-L1]
MKLGIMQPYFFPYIGYWQLIKTVDTYVIYDDVNYKKKGWINRNIILVNGEEMAISLKITKVSQNKRINEIEIENDVIYNKKLLKTIKETYSKAPYFHEVFNLIENVINQKETNLAKYLTNSIQEICKYLNIQTTILLSSDLKKNEVLKGQDKILEICELLSAKEYVNAYGGLSLYSSMDFESKGVKLKLIKTNDIAYPQKELANFVPNLSIIDVMMFNSPVKISAMLDDFTVIKDFAPQIHSVSISD